MQGIERQAEQYDFTEAVQTAAPEGRTASHDLPSYDDVKDLLGGPSIHQGMMQR